MVADLTEPCVTKKILEVLGGPAELLLSDAAPKLTGVRATDRAHEEALLEAVLRLVPELLRPGGDLLVKLLEGPEAAALAHRIARNFETAKSLRPAASRKGTSERYLLARNYRGGETASS